MAHTRADWSQVRCLFESPILDERKWAKIPSIPADAFILDLEDSVPLDRKDEARQKVVEYIGRPDYFGGALTVPRANHLDTPWGEDDLLAFAAAGAEIVMYPKTSSVADANRALEVLRSHGCDASLLVCIESAQGVAEVEEIFQVDEVVCATFGPGDLNVDARIPLYGPDGEMNPALVYPKGRVALAGAAYGVPTLGIAYMQDIKDEALVRRRVQAEQLFGFTGCAAFYPPHVPIINEIFSPSEHELVHARNLIAAYEEAVAKGNPAVQLANGEAVLVHQYKEAKDLVARAR